jgi:hypothetical protein
VFLLGSHHFPVLTLNGVGQELGTTRGHIQRKAQSHKNQLSAVFFFLTAL